MIVLLSVLMLAAVPVEFSVREPFSLAVEKAIRENTVSLEEGLRLRELAVRHPDRLPEPWRSMAKRAPVPGWAGTGILVENFQIRKRAGLRVEDGFPQPLPLHLDSQTFPIRVEYPSDDHLRLAQAVLEGAETAWQKEIVEWGFLVPPHVTAENPYRILVGDTGMQAAGYMSPVDYWPSTPWDDCTSWIMIDWQNDPEWVRDTVAHELSHATQGAMDCLEYIGFWENTSTFIEGQVEPGLGIYFQDAVLDYYQAEPHRSVSAGEYMDYYWYGGFFWPHFLASYYRLPDEEPAVFVRKLWEGAMQESGGYYNSPNYMQSIDALLRQRGANLGEAYRTFAWQRFLVGDSSNSSLARIQWAERYHATPPYTGEILPAQAGVLNVKQGNLPQAYGANYWQLGIPAGYARDLRVKLTSSTPGPWSLVLFHPFWNEVFVSPIQEGEAELIFHPESPVRPILAVVRGGTEDFDPEAIGPGAGYQLEYGPVVPDPVVESVTPFEHEQGACVQLVVAGRHFQEGIQARFLPADVRIESIDFVGPEELVLHVCVDAKALLGVYQLEVTNPDGGKGTFDRAIYVHAASVRPSLDGDCSCRAGKGGASVPPLFLLWVVGVAWILRRRWHSVSN